MISPPAPRLYQLSHAELCSRYWAEARMHESKFLEEFSIIGEVGYQQYFLTLWKLLQECAEFDIGLLLPDSNLAFTAELSDAPRGTPTTPLGKAIRVPCPTSKTSPRPP